MTIYKPVLLALGIAMLTLSGACDREDLLPLKVYLGGRTVSKLPFVIAYDQGLYRKYGLDIDLRLPDPRNDLETPTHATHLLARGWRWIKRKSGGAAWKSDIYVDGHTPSIVKFVDRADFPHRQAIAGIDCIARAHIIAQKGISNLEELKNARIGISGRRDTTTGFMALTLAKRMGWDPVMDISIKLNGRDIEDLEAGRVDAIVASETRYAKSTARDFPVLADLRDWDVALGGNSAMVEAGWLEHPQNAEAARRFLQALIEGLALFHGNRTLALDVITRWYGIVDTAEAAIIYERGQWLERKPYPCYEGISNTLALYASNEMQKYEPADFYNDTLIRRLDAQGFIDEVYQLHTAEQ